MLQAAAQEAVALDDPLLAVKVEVADARPRLARDRHGDARAGQAALVLGHRIALDLEDLGVDEDDGVALLLLAVDDDKALEHAELGRGQTASVVFVHRLDHLLGELLQALVVQVARLADGVEQGVG